MDSIERLEEQANILFNNIAGWENSTLQRIGKRIKKHGRLSLADVKSINYDFGTKILEECQRMIDEALGS